VILTLFWDPDVVRKFSQSAARWFVGPTFTSDDDIELVQLPSVRLKLTGAPETVP
jgi:hypothetical protein